MDELEKHKSEEFEKFFGFLPEEGATDPQGRMIVAAVLDYARNAVVAAHAEFERSLANVNLTEPSALERLARLRSIVKIAENDLSRAEMMAQKTGYVSETSNKEASPTLPSIEI